MQGSISKQSAAIDNGNRASAVFTSGNTNLSSALSRPFSEMMQVFTPQVATSLTFTRMFRFTFSCVSSVRSRQSYCTSARRGKALRNLIQLQCAFDTYRTMSALGRLMHGLTLNAKKTPACITSGC